MMDSLKRVIVFIILATFGNCKPAQWTCGGKAADVVFLLDASSSIWEPNFKKQLNFVSNVVDVFDVGNGEKQIRVGALTFSDHSTVHLHLDTSTDKSTVQKSLQKIPYQTGGTNTSGALLTSRIKMFSDDHSSRPEAVRIAIVLTDGQSEDTDATYTEAMALKSTGVQVFAIGVGFGIDTNEMEVIASDPSSQFVFTVDDFEALDSIKEALAIRTCEATRLTTPESTPPVTTPVFTTTESVEALADKETTKSRIPAPTKALGDQGYEKSTKVCQGKPAEVFFVLDSSSSILKEEFDKQSKFVQHVIELFDLGEDKTRVGLSTFSDSVYPMINLGGYVSRQDLLSLVDQIPYLSGGTNTGEALRDMRERGMAPEVVRREVAHVAIVLTDGQSRDPKTTAMQAKAAKEQGVYVFAIGIGDDVDRKELIDIASEPMERFVFHVSNYDALESIKDILAIRACEVDPVDKVGDRNTCPERPTDVMFMYDSGKMGAQKSAEVSSLIAKTITGLPMSESSFKFGVMADTCPQNGNRLSLSADRLSLTSQLTGNKRRNLESLFYDIRAKAFKTEYGARDSAEKVAVLFMDSKFENYNRIVAHAKRTKARGIKVLVVAMSPDILPSHVKDVASEPLMSNFLNIATLTGNLSHKMGDLICGQLPVLDVIDEN